jgi:hypothetical protein
MRTMRAWKDDRFPLRDSTDTDIQETTDDGPKNN